MCFSPHSPWRLRLPFRATDSATCSAKSDNDEAKMGQARQGALWLDREYVADQFVREAGVGPLATMINKTWYEALDGI